MYNIMYTKCSENSNKKKSTKYNTYYIKSQYEFIKIHYILLDSMFLITYFWDFKHYIYSTIIYCFTVFFFKKNKDSRKVKSILKCSQ